METWFQRSGEPRSWQGQESSSVPSQVDPDGSAPMWRPVTRRMECRAFLPASVWFLPLPFRAQPTATPWQTAHSKLAAPTCSSPTEMLAGLPPSRTEVLCPLPGDLDGPGTWGGGLHVT